MTEEKEPTSETGLTTRIMTNEKFRQLMKNNGFKNAMESKIFAIPGMYLSTIDKGSFFRKPFSLLYALIAVFNIYIPVHIFIAAVENDIFNASFKTAFVFLMILFSMVIASVFGFYIWWRRKDELEAGLKQNELIATPLFACFIQTAGEFLGVWIGIVGFTASLSTWIFLRGVENTQIPAIIGVHIPNLGFAGAIIMLISGYLAVIASRFLAEQLKALASIVNYASRNAAR